MRVFEKDGGGEYSDIDLYTTILQTFANISVSYAYATHMFDMTMIDGATVALMTVQ